jgi:hypothetical protein
MAKTDTWDAVGFGTRSTAGEIHRQVTDCYTRWLHRRGLPSGSPFKIQCHSTPELHPAAIRVRVKHRRRRKAKQ